MSCPAFEHLVSRRLIRIGFGDTDLMGIVHHARYLSFFETARVEYMRRRGIDYASSANDGVHLAVIEASVRYRSPARFDDVVLVECSLHKVSGATVRFDYRVERHCDQELLVEGSTLLACLGASLKPRRLPTELRQRLLAGETASRPIDCV